MKQLLALFLIFFFLLLASPRNVFACDLTFTPSSLQAGQLLHYVVTKEPASQDNSTLTFEVIAYLEGKKTFSENTSPLSPGMTYSGVVAYQASAGTYNVTAYSTDGGSNHCGNSIKVGPQASPPGGNPAAPLPLGSPKTWLSQINPGFGPSASLGLGFLTGNIIPFAIGMLIFLIIIGSLVFVIVGGIMWITSKGEKEGYLKAKNTITWALIGLTLGICSLIIMGILGRILGVNLIGSSTGMSQEYCRQMGIPLGQCN